MEIDTAYLTEWGIKIGIALAILIVGRMLAKWVVSLVSKGLEKKGVDKAVVSFIGNISYVMLLIAVLIAAMSQLGIDTTSLVAVLGAAGLAVGFALQGSLSNFASGVLIVMLRPFKSGDFVEAGGCMGTIQSIELFSTTLKTPDNKVIIVPNAAITGGTITNFSAENTRRIDYVIGISYDANIKTAKDTLLKIYEEEQRFLRNPAVTIAVSELADSSVNLVFRPWVNSSDYWPVYFDVLEKIKTEFDANNIGIPYPQMDVHISKES